MRRVPQQHANSHVRRERDGRSLTRQVLLLSCCVVLAAGFIFAARQKIVAVQYGYRSEELRRERERLLAEREHLLLAVEEHSSPATLERAAQGLGLQPARASQIHSSEPVALEEIEAPHDDARDTRQSVDGRQSVKRAEAARSSAPAPKGAARTGR